MPINPSSSNLPAAFRLAIRTIPSRKDYFLPRNLWNTSEQFSSLETTKSVPHIRLEEDIQVELAKKFIAAMIEFNKDEKIILKQVAQTVQRRRAVIGSAEAQSELSGHSTVTVISSGVSVWKSAFFSCTTTSSSWTDRQKDSLVRLQVKKTWPPFIQHIFTSFFVILPNK